MTGVPSKKTSFFKRSLVVPAIIGAVIILIIGILVIGLSSKSKSRPMAASLSEGQASISEASGLGNPAGCEDITTELMMIKVYFTSITGAHIKFGTTNILPSPGSIDRSALAVLRTGDIQTFDSTDSKGVNTFFCYPVNESAFLVNADSTVWPALSSPSIKQGNIGYDISLYPTGHIFTQLAEMSKTNMINLDVYSGTKYLLTSSYPVSVSTSGPNISINLPFSAITAVSNTSSVLRLSISDLDKGAILKQWKVLTDDAADNIPASLDAVLDNGIKIVTTGGPKDSFTTAIGSADSNTIFVNIDDRNTVKPAFLMRIGILTNDVAISWDEKLYTKNPNPLGIKYIYLGYARKPSVSYEGKYKTTYGLPVLLYDDISNINGRPINLETLLASSGLDFSTGFKVTQIYNLVVWGTTTITIPIQTSHTEPVLAKNILKNWYSNDKLASLQLSADSLIEFTPNPTSTVSKPYAYTKFELPLMDTDQIPNTLTFDYKALDTTINPVTVVFRTAGTTKYLTLGKFRSPSGATMFEDLKTSDNRISVNVEDTIAAQGLTDQVGFIGFKGIQELRISGHAEFSGIIQTGYSVPRTGPDVMKFWIFSNKNSAKLSEDLISLTATASDKILDSAYRIFEKSARIPDPNKNISNTISFKYLPAADNIPNIRIGIWTNDITVRSGIKEIVLRNYAASPAPAGAGTTTFTGRLALSPSNQYEVNVESFLHSIASGDSGSYGDKYKFLGIRSITFYEGSQFSHTPVLSWTAPNMSAPSKPDLVVKGFTVSDIWKVKDSSHKIVADVRNIGPSDSPASNIKWFYDNTMFYYGAFGPFTAGADVPVRTNNNTISLYTGIVLPGKISKDIITSGDHIIKYCIDTDNTVIESDETNNCYEKSLTFVPKDPTKIEPKPEPAPIIPPLIQPTPEPVPVPAPAPVPVPEPEPTPAPVPAPAPVPMPTPEPTPTPVPTPEPQPVPVPIVKTIEPAARRDSRAVRDNLTQYTPPSIAISLLSDLPKEIKQINDKKIQDIEKLPDTATVTGDLSPKQKAKLGLDQNEQYTSQSILPDSVIDKLFPQYKNELKTNASIPDPAVLDIDKDGLSNAYELFVSKTDIFNKETVRGIPDSYTAIFNKTGAEIAKELSNVDLTGFNITYPSPGSIIGNGRIYILGSAKKHDAMFVIHILSGSDILVTASGTSDANGFLITQIPRTLDVGKYTVEILDESGRTTLDKSAFTITGDLQAFKFEQVLLETTIPQNDIKIGVKVPPNMLVIANWKSLLAASAALSSVFMEETYLYPPENTLLEPGPHTVTLILKDKDTGVITDVIEKNFTVTVPEARASSQSGLADNVFGSATPNTAAYILIIAGIVLIFTAIAKKPE